jgi:peptidoglycan/xylan/chitin deacetylase (PgdA/CDA1 family)
MTAKTIAILGYHKIGPPSPTAWVTWYYVPTEIFAKQMADLRDSDWTVIDAAALVRGLREPETMPSRAALITFDDAYVSVLEHAAPILARHNFPGVVFLPTAQVGGENGWDRDSREPIERICSWDELRELESAGLSIQSHAVTHRTFSELTADEIDREVRESKRSIEQALGKPVDLLAYPFDDAGNDHAATDASLARAGYRAAFHFVGGVSRFPLDNPFHFTRLPVWPDTDLRAELAIR